MIMKLQILLKLKKKKFEFFIDCGNPPSDKFLKHYQAGCLSFELISNKQKVICNSGYGKYLSSKLTSLSRSTAAHSTLYLNDTSSSIFQKNKKINKIYGNTLIEKHKELGGRARVFKRNGFTFDGGPTVITAPHLIYEIFQLDSCC